MPLYRAFGRGLRSSQMGKVRTMAQQGQDGSCGSHIFLTGKIQVFPLFTTFRPFPGSARFHGIGKNQCYMAVWLIFRSILVPDLRMIVTKYYSLEDRRITVGATACGESTIFGGFRTEVKVHGWSGRSWNPLMYQVLECWYQRQSKRGT